MTWQFTGLREGQLPLVFFRELEQGMTDENKLTNLVFLTRHPELGGRRIRADERDLASEWRQIRRDVVRPVLERVGQELFVEAHDAPPEDQRFQVSPAMKVRGRPGRAPAGRRAAT